MSMTSLAELFPDEDFRFHLTLRRGEPREFFRAWSPNGELLEERKRWLSAQPERYARLTPEGEPLLDEFEVCCGEWDLFGGTKAPGSTKDGSGERGQKLREMGGVLEPDFLLLSADQSGQFRLRGGVLCFPTGWALEEKIGHTLDFIHDVVPGLNPVLGSPINQFLGKLKPGIAFFRDNWGISASDERNQHPSRRLPGPNLPVELQRLWLRVEHQALVALPRSKGVLFGIRIAMHRLDELISEQAMVSGLIRALASMPESVAAYKRLAEVRMELIAQLRLTVT